VTEARRLGGQRRRRDATLAAVYDFDGLGSVAQIQRVVEIAGGVGHGTGQNSAARSRCSRPSRSHRPNTTGWWRKGERSTCPSPRLPSCSRSVDRRADGPTTEAGYRRELKRLVKDGSLRTRGSGQTIEIETGSVYDHGGVRFEALPPGGWRYEPLAEEEYRTARMRVSLTTSALGPADRGPGLPPQPLTVTDGGTVGSTNEADVARDLLAGYVQREARSCWSRLLAIEAVTAEGPWRSFCVIDWSRCRRFSSRWVQAARACNG
jgi:hypothetical protein